MVRKVFKERINELYREQQKQEPMSATAMAKKAGISPAAMNFYLAGDRRPDLEALYKICSSFNCSADWLLGLTDVRSSSQDIQTVVTTLGISETFVEKQKNLDADTRRALYRLIEMDGFMEAVLGDYIDYETVQEGMNKSATAKDIEDECPEYNPQKKNGYIVLPTKDAALYYAKKTGDRLSRLLDKKTNCENCDFE